MTGFDRDLIGEGFDRGDAGVTKFREERFWEFRHPRFTRFIEKVTPKG